MTLIARISFFCIALGIFLASCNVTSEKHLNISTLCKKIANEKSIIGLGESTHGTKEFTQLRTEIVKELVEKYNYRSFILEAEYSKCENINRYILTGQGDPNVLLDEIGLWPWKNKGFLDLIIWMKDFNLAQSTNPLQFFGMDSQSYSSYLQCIEYNLPNEYIDRYIDSSRDSLLKKYPLDGQLICDIEGASIDPAKTIRELRNLAKKWEVVGDDIDLELQYFVQTRIHSQSMIEPKDMNVRDQNMAALVVLIQTKFQQKAIIWAHNGHVFRGDNKELNFISLGYHLEKIYQDQYSVVGFDFKEGTFNAIPNDGSSTEITIFDYHKLTETLSSKIDFEKRDYIITDCSRIKSYFHTNSVGATYRISPKEVSRYTEKVHGNTEFDFIVSIPLSTPTELLAASRTMNK